MKLKYIIKNRIKALLLLLGSKPNARRILLRHLNRMSKYVYQSIQLLEKSNLNLKPTQSAPNLSVDELVSLLNKYDVVSFDVFDTLIFRSVRDPKDIFEILGLLHNVQLFKKIRSEAERDARKNSINVDHDTTIDEIYELIEHRSGINKDFGISLEISVEKAVCFANPYMKEVFQKLKAMNKQIVITSDMYLPQDTIRNILEENGYKDFAYLAVSSHNGRMKTSGGLQKIVAEHVGVEKKIIHVGDNVKADIDASQKVGWATYYYKNISCHDNVKGMSTLGGSLYHAIVNSELYNGGWNNDPFFTFGFKYLGIIICTYCIWLNKLAADIGATKILFPARDMYLTHKIYNKYFHKYSNEYAQISRVAAIFMDFDNSCEMLLNYIKDYLKSPRQLTIDETLRKSGLSCLIPQIKNYSLSLDEIFTKNNFSNLRDLVYDNKDVVKQHYSEHITAAEKYFNTLCATDKKILFADTNGRCTSLLALSHLMKNKNIDFVGSFLYSVSDPGYVESKFTNQTLYACLFSYVHNRDLFFQFRKNVNTRTDILETLFTAPNNTLRSYGMGSSDDVVFFYGDASISNSHLENLLGGVELFVEKYLEFTQNLPMDIEFSPVDAWLPINSIIDAPETLDLFSKLISNQELNT